MIRGGDSRGTREDGGGRSIVTVPRDAQIPTSEAISRSHIALRLLPLLVLLLAGFAVWWSGVADMLSLQQLAENREMLRTFVAGHLAIALLAYALLYIAVVALSVPAGAPLTLAGGFLFGCITGSLVVLLSATVGALLIFLLARGTLAAPLSRIAGPRLERLRAGFQENAFSYLLFLRLVPVFPFWLVNLAPALLGVSARIFVLATFVGIIPGTLAFSLTGAGLDSVIVTHYEAYQACLANSALPEGCAFDLDPASFLTPKLLFAFATFGFVALIPAIVKRVWKRMPKPE
jgi:uncharacterized membrane protein YdjX (TVP38/TMEM64 family)